ncbi:MAG TPA: carbohydrate ABC transporter permease [Candidatus Hydrogenedentes bacterium]|nr:carbohydrate ABC transporter permease [Candidatus Hydrogenedentota bacterium]
MATLNKYANNYRDVLRQVPLWAYVKNSFLLVGLNIVGQILGSSLVAYGFARLRWPGREFCFMLVLATLMIPAQVTMIPVFLIFKYLGWYNTLRPLWVPAFFGSAFYIFLLRQFMRGIPSDLEDSAKIDGCGFLGTYGRIILPLIKPALAAIGIFTFMGVWNDFMGPLIYLSDQELYPLSLGLFALQVFRGGNFGLMMAASVLMTVPVVLLFFAAQRHFIQGITLTGMKA